MKKKTILLSALLLALIAGQFALMNHKLLKTRRSLNDKLKRYRRDHKAFTFALNKNVPFAFSLPKELDQVPFVDDSIILSVKDIQLRNVFAPYNASIIEKDDDSYGLFFRYDLVRQMHLNHFDTHIGYVELDENFDQTERDFIKIKTHSVHSEDPRVLKAKDSLYLIYNDVPFNDFIGRKMHIALLDSESLQPLAITKMDPHLGPVEKNWVPFAYENTVHFEYQIFTPRKVLRLEDPLRPNLSHISDPLPVGNLDWEKKWGEPRGGTSARLVDGEYLAFFHSRFKDGMGTYWYVMGAYTFEAQLPFRVTKMSKHPIIYKDLYKTESVNTSDPQKFVIFPSGYAIKQYGEKTLIHLACGENDCAVKIVTIDKEALKKSLVPIEP